MGMLNIIFRKNTQYGDLLFLLACWIQQWISCNNNFENIVFKELHWLSKRINLLW